MISRARARARAEGVRPTALAALMLANRRSRMAMLASPLSEGFRDKTMIIDPVTPALRFRGTR
jgi:hypothetical protein